MINSNVALDLKQVSGVPYWKARGADTWNPFKTSNGGAQSVTLYILAYESSTTGLGEGIYVTITKDNVRSIGWGTNVAGKVCPSNGKFGAMVWVTAWNE